MNRHPRPGIEPLQFDDCRGAPDSTRLGPQPQLGKGTAEFTSIRRHKHPGTDASAQRLHESIANGFKTSMPSGPARAVRLVGAEKLREPQVTSRWARVGVSPPGWPPPPAARGTVWTRPVPHRSATTAKSSLSIRRSLREPHGPDPGIDNPFHAHRSGVEPTRCAPPKATSGDLGTLQASAGRL